MLDFLRRRIQSNAFMGGVHLVACWYARIVHRLRVEGVHPGTIPSDRLIVIANHVSGIDAVMLQVALPREIRWMMERQMMPASFDWLWRRIRAIPVESSGATTALRESFRHLNGGGVLGIFPEGQIGRPPGRIQVFRPGLAQISARTRSSVAVFVLDGIAPCGNPFWSLVRPSRARVRLLAVIPPPVAGEESAWTLGIREQMARALGASVDVAHK